MNSPFRFFHTLCVCALVAGLALVACSEGGRDDSSSEFRAYMQSADSLLVVGDTLSAGQSIQWAVSVASNNEECMEALLRGLEINYGAKQSDIEKCVEYFQNLKATDRRSRQLKLRAFLCEIDYFTKQNRLNDAAMARAAAIALAYELEVSETYISLSNQIFKQCEAAGNYVEAIEGYRCLLEYATERGLNSDVINTLYSLQDVFRVIGDEPKTQFYLDQIAVLQDTSSLAKCRYELALANLYSMHSDNQGLKTSVRKLQSLRQSPEVQKNYGCRIAVLEANYYLGCQMLDSVQSSVNWIVMHPKEAAAQHLSNDVVAIIVAKSQLRFGKTSKAKMCLDEVDGAKLRHSDVNLYEEYADVVSEYYAAIGEHKLAYDYLSTKSLLLDSLKRETVSHDIAYQNMSMKRDTTIISQKLAMERQQKYVERLSLVRSIFFVTLIIFVVAGFGVYFYVTTKRLERKSKELKKLSERLEEEVKSRQQTLREQSIQLESKNMALNAEISVASRVQACMLTPDAVLDNEYISDFFVLFRPCSRVSGDFYWFFDTGDKLFVCVGDATGHGIPGALISMVASSMLGDLIQSPDNQSPLALLQGFDAGLSTVLRNNMDIDNRDSVDASIFCFDKQSHRASVALARHIAYVLRADGSLSPIPGVKRSVCEHDELMAGRPFVEVDLDMQPGDTIYMTSDGFESQFGGPKDQKFKRARLASLFLECAALPLDEQKNTFIDRFEKWKGVGEQTDDVLLVGLKLA